MEQLSIRDWMVIIGAMMIAAVLIDAVRRYWRERRAEVRLNARIDRSAPLSDDDDAFNLLTELPNGGARIMRRDDLFEDGVPNPGEALSDDAASDIDDEVQSLQAPDPIDLAVEAIEAESAAGLGDSSEDATADEVRSTESVVEGAAVDTEATGAVQPEGDKEVVPESNKTEASPRRRTVKPPPDDGDLPATEEGRDAGTVDWLDSLDPDEEDESELTEAESPDHGRLPRGADTHVFILYAVARSEEGFSGTDILETLLACDLRFGDMDFFHRHEQASGRGPIEFSVANMMKPGVFDIDNMEPLQTRGLMFFVTLPGPTDMLKAFDYMYETAKVVAKALNGDIQDETRSLVTRQSLEHMRQQIRELERRLLVRRN
jgi:cell division protein ZipA